MSEQSLPTQHLAKPIMAYIEQAYYEYATYVIHDRALPFIGDGLKPVARRIIYAMRELSLHATAKHKKSARTVGDVLGKFHPHGDTACYEAMVLMAQSFSYRYPFIDGQGNWGSIDEPKSFAAMRYTEARLSHYAEVLLTELGENTVSWVENFDGSMKEPEYLPARLPNVILNGAMGIAVGIATDIAPHNIHEVVGALLHIIRHPDCDDDAILEHILGPDLPTGGILISSRSDIISAYKTGHGNYRVRATFEKEHNTIVITSLPYQVSTAKIMRQIADLVIEKKLSHVEDIRDDSDEQHAVRISLLLKNKADIEAIMQHIYAVTECEKTYRIQQYVLNNQHRPHLFTLPELLREWLEFRKKVVVLRIQSQIDALEARLHILSGLKIITLHIDEVIRIIRYEDDPDVVLMKQYALSERQVKAILDIRLKQLTKVEWLALDKEFQEKDAQCKALVLILNSPKHFKKLLEDELKNDALRYGNPRRTRVDPQEAAVRPSKVALPILREDIKVFLSREMWVRASRNLSTSSDTLVYHSSDGPYLEAIGMTDEAVTLWDLQGNVFTIKALEIPSVRGKGEPLSQWIETQSPLGFLIMGKEDQKVCVLSSDGYGFITTLGHAQTRLKSGKKLVTIPEGTKLQHASLFAENSKYLACMSMQGRLSIIALSEMPFLKKGRGLKMMQFVKNDLLAAKDGLIAVSFLDEQSVLELRKNDQVWQQTPDQWKKLITKRGLKGQFVPRNFRSSLTDMRAVDSAQKSE